MNKKDIDELLELCKFQYKPRNPDRIESFLKELELFWKLHPDLRFIQLIQVITGGEDMFYAEDDVILNLIMGLINQTNSCRDKLKRLDNNIEVCGVFRCEHIGEQILGTGILIPQFIYKNNDDANLKCKELNDKNNRDDIHFYVDIVTIK